MHTINTGGMLAVICLISSIGAAAGRPLAPSAVTPDAVRAFDGLALQIDRHAMPNRQAFTIDDVPLDINTSVTLDLERFDVLTPDAILIAVHHDADGRPVETQLPRPTMHFLHGQVAGEPDS